MSILASETRNSLQRLLVYLTPRECERLKALTLEAKSRWTLQARPNQLPPSGDWLVWLLLAGRGFGKTRTGAEWACMMARSFPGLRGALVGRTPADARDAMIEGESGILHIGHRFDRPLYESSKRRLTWPNGSIATVYTSYEPDKLRGPQHHWAWCDELASWRYARETWDMLMLGLRLGQQPRCVVTTTPRPIPPLREIIAASTTVITRGTTYDNLANLAPSFRDQVLRKYEGTRLGRQELNAEILEDAEGALWKRDMLDKYRVTETPTLKRIVVAIDPSATGGEQADEAGIVAAGRGVDDHLYVLDDRSLRASPHGWASEAVALYHVLKADRIVGETNNGGEMVELTVRTVDKNASYKGVHASRGKQARAEPVAALYEQGRGHHVGTLGSLEDELCQWVPGEGASPNRLDALVWAATELMFGDSGDVQYMPSPY